jgi:hypothetical protein
MASTADLDDLEARLAQLQVLQETHGADSTEVQMCAQQLLGGIHVPVQLMEPVKIPFTNIIDTLGLSAWIMRGMRAQTATRRPEKTPFRSENAFKYRKKSQLGFDQKENSSLAARQITDIPAWAAR